MPTYDYECSECGNTMELFQSITAEPKKELHCEVCNKQTAVRRLLGTGGALIFKGSGFYATDYRSESYKKAAKADTSKTNGTAKSESASSGNGSDKKADKSSNTAKAGKAATGDKT